MLWLKDPTGSIFEVINQARTAAYLANGALAVPGISICDILEYGGCQTYTMTPRCTDEGGWIDTPGVTGNGVLTVDAAALDITGDLTLVVRGRLDDPTPASTVWMIGKGTTYRLGLASTGFLVLEWVDSGAVTRTRTGNEDITPYINTGAAPYLAATLDVNNGAAGHDVRFWRSWDGENWDQVGTTNTTAGTTTIQASSNDLYVGASANTNQVAGEWLYAAVDNFISTGGLPSPSGFAFEYDGIADLEGVAADATSFVASSGQTVTVNHTGGTPTVIFPFLSGDDWETQNYDTPATDDAPWYSAEYPESADAIGFWVEEWTGLDDRHVSRAFTRYGTPRGGATAGAIGNAERVMKINIYLLGSTEESVEYLFRWLASTLSGVCGTCDLDSVLTRRFCGSVEDPWWGMVEMRQVGLIEGLGWESDVAETGRCFFRHASFTLAAGDPCMYLKETSPTVTTQALADVLGELILDDDNYSLTRQPCRPTCSELRDPAHLAAYWTFDVTESMGAMGAVVTFSNDSGEHNFPFRAILYYDPGEMGVTVSPCGMLQAAELYVRPLPPDSQLRWDITGRDILYRDVTTGDFISSYAFIDANDPPTPRFNTLACGRFHLALEPATLCLERIGGVGHVFEWQGLTFSEPAFPDVDVVLQERVSCA